MIRCTIADLEQRCRERGYSLPEVAPCIVLKEQNFIVVDEKHPSYPLVFKPAVGTELKKLLRRLGIKSNNKCHCDNHALEMNLRGPQWCKDNRGVIIGWMREEAMARKLPFSEVVANFLLERAIKSAVAKSVSPPV